MLELRDVTVVYPDKTKAVDCLSFSAARGESIALVGENGAGKTSLLLAMVGILEPISGVIEVDGVRLSAKTAVDVRKRIGMVFQNPDDQLFTPLIYDDVAFGCRNSGMPENLVRQRVEETLAALSIGHLIGRSPLRLSGGEKRMASIATVLAMEPSVLLFDEPTVFLDPKARRVLAESIKKLPHTKIVATHDLAFAADVGGRVVALKNGRVAADGGICLLRDSEIMESCGLEAVV